MSTLFYLFLGLILVVAFLLVVVIMVQNPKGGGLSSSFGGGGTQQLGGVKKTGDFLDKSTWVLSTLLLVLILAAGSVLITEKTSTNRDITDPNNIEVPASLPTPAVDSNDTATPVDGQ